MTVNTQSIQQLTIPTPFPVGDVHTYLLKGDTLSLVDAGVKTHEAWDALKTQLKACGYRPRDIEQVILTHHHPDHTGLVDEFPQARSIVAHENVDVWLRKDETFFRWYESFFKTAFARWGVSDHYIASLDKLRAPLNYAGSGEVTSIIKDGDRLPGHPDFRVIETKGHAQTHLSFLRDEDGSFIAGDHLLPHMSSNPLLEAPYDKENRRPKPLLEYRMNLKKCLDMKIQTIYPGHGSPFSDFRTLIPKRLKKQENQAKKLLTFMSDVALTPFQLCMRLYPHRYTKQLDLTMSQTIGLLDLLHEQQAINQITDGGVIYFRAA